MGIERIGIVGAGLMGSGIAEVAAVAGADVVVVEIHDLALEAGRTRIEGSMAKAVDRGKLEPADRDAASARIAYSTDLAVMADRDLAIEAVVEDEEAKAAVFRDLAAAAPGAILASNTSSIPIMKLAMATNRPGDVVGLHFFNPVPVMQLVEVVPSLLTTEETVTKVMEWAQNRLGKTVVRAPDRGGFIVNALLVPYLLDAIRFFEAGHATADDIDAGMRFGANHPMGPLALCDLIGNDTMLHVAESLFDELRETRMAPPPLLRRMVEAGRLGRKAGNGFYDYS